MQHRGLHHQPATTALGLAVWTAAELVAARLKGLPLDVQQKEISAMLTRHLRVRDVVGRVLLLSRERRRVAKSRSASEVNVDAAARRALRQHLASPTLTRERKSDGAVTTAIGNALVELVGTVMAFSLVDYQDRDARAIVELLEAEAQFPSEISNIVRAAHHAASRACEQGYDARATTYAAVLMSVAGPVDHFSGTHQLALSIFSMPIDFILYMVNAQGTKSNAPQQVAALALAMLGFTDAIAHSVILAARRVHDPHARIDRAQIRRLTRSWRLSPGNGARQRMPVRGKDLRRPLSR